MFGELDFAAMKEGKPDALFDAWLALPDGARNEMDAKLRDIFALCCGKGFLAILDEARGQLHEDPEVITSGREAIGATQPLRAGDGHLPRPQGVRKSVSPSSLSSALPNVLEERERLKSPVRFRG